MGFIDAVDKHVQEVFARCTHKDRALLADGLDLSARTAADMGGKYAVQSRVSAEFFAGAGCIGNIDRAGQIP